MQNGLSKDECRPNKANFENCKERYHHYPEMEISRKEQKHIRRKHSEHDKHQPVNPRVHHCKFY